MYGVNFSSCRFEWMFRFVFRIAFIIVVVVVSALNMAIKLRHLQQIISSKPGANSCGIPGTCLYNSDPNFPPCTCI